MMGQHRAADRVGEDSVHGTVDPLAPGDVLRTYRYLRIGMLGSVVLLAMSILYERSKVDCWQTSISAYYYTPVRALFVGSLIAIGLALIVYKGRRPSQDRFLNAAGMLAPVVAVVPTTDVGDCWSVTPRPLPVEDGELAAWVVTNIENNVAALLLVGTFALLVTAIIAVSTDPTTGRRAGPRFTNLDRSTAVSLALVTGALLAGWLLSRSWDGFNDHAHGYAAIALFIALFFVVVGSARERPARDGWFWAYTATAAMMALGAAFIVLTGVFGDHMVFALEAYEIALFGVYWGLQTVERWHEGVIGGTTAAVDGATS